VGSTSDHRAWWSERVIRDLWSQVNLKGICIDANTLQVHLTPPIAKRLRPAQSIVE
jgi:hypothetical protein